MPTLPGNLRGPAPFAAILADHSLSPLRLLPRCFDLNGLFWPTIPFAGFINTRYSGCVERQVTARTRSFRK